MHLNGKIDLKALNHSVCERYCLVGELQALPRPRPLLNTDHSYWTAGEQLGERKPDECLGDGGGDASEN